jgi:AAA+ ATPase superfamily predicted ATPase
MFVGRRRELGELTRLYDTGKFQCVIVYGRRRVGKTALINEFVKDKDAIYFTGLETNAKENLSSLSRSIFALSRDFTDSAPVFTAYGDALDAVFAQAKTRRTVFVIDEYPYLAVSYKGFSSLLQRYIDEHKDDSKLFIILCGSSLSFMENQVLGYKSPLYGRRTAQFKVLPFDYAETMEYLEADFGAGDAALLYAITGGVPLYLSMIDRGANPAENIKMNFLTPSGYLFEEPSNLVKQECREPAQYNAIIGAVANGASRLSEIASKVGLETAVCSSYLSKLISIGIVKKEYPFRAETNKKTIYVLADGMFRFWYRFLPENMSLVQRGEAEAAYERIAPHLPAFMGAVFEEICKQHLWRLNAAGQTPFTFTDAGRWWGNNPKKREECEIDIIADDGESAIFCECKWTNEAVGLDAAETLIERSELFRYKNKYYCLFAKTGFTDGVRAEAARMGNMTLIGFDDFYLFSRYLA